MRKAVEAIQAYRRQHNGSYPPTLATLIELRLAEASDLQCPDVLAELGRSSPTLNLATSTSLKGEIQIAYEYELSTNVIMHDFRRNPTTRKAVREMLLRRPFWEQIPIIRCKGHAYSAPRDSAGSNPTHLNITSSGHAYLSGMFWEENWIKDVPFTNRTDIVADGLQGPPYTSGMAFPIIHGLDLGSWNNSFGNHAWWLGATLFNHRDRIITAPVLTSFFSNHPSGWLKPVRENYWFEALVQLQGRITPTERTDLTAFNRPAFPATKVGLEVKRACPQVSWLQATVWEGKRGEPVGWMVWHYEDGQTEKVPIIYGSDTARFWADSTQEASEVNFVAPVWRQGTSEAGGQNPLMLRVYEQKWINPRPEAAIATLDFVSNMDSAAGPLLIAMTAAPDA